MTGSLNNWNAPDYAANSGAQAAWAGELIGKLHLRETEHLLDIGCGDGKITAAIAGMVPGGSVTGIDRSGDMIALARRTYAAPNLDFAVMDAVDIALEGPFDAAFSNAALHWVHNQPAMLAGLKRCLVPGGRLLFQMGGRGNAADVVAVVERLIALDEWKKHFEGFTFPYNFCGPDDYGQWLIQAGFVPERMELIPKDMVHDCPEQLKGWLRTTWFPYTDRLPEKKREPFLDTVIDRYVAAHPADDAGRTHVRMVRLEVEAVPG